MRQCGQRSIVSLFSSDHRTSNKVSQASLVDFLSRKKLVSSATDKHPITSAASEAGDRLKRGIKEKDDRDADEEIANSSIESAVAVNVSVRDSLVSQRLSKLKSYSSSEEERNRKKITKVRRHRLTQEGRDLKRSRHLLVLGDDPSTRPHVGMASFHHKTQVIYNHYSDGAGFWDEEMVGLDGQLGGVDEWEGVGSMSLGNSLGSNL